MEWVETTGKTIAEAKERALDGLGVDDADAEFEVLQEPRTGLFGRVRTEARVRARVRPTTPPSKEDRRDRRRRRRGSGAAGGGDTGESARVQAVQEPTPTPEAREATAGASSQNRVTAGAASASGASPSGGSSSARRRPHRSRQAARARRATDSEPDGSGSSAAPTTVGRARAGSTTKQGTTRQEHAAVANGAPVHAGQDEGEDAGMEVALEEQGRVAQAFLTGMVQEMGLQAAVAVQPRDEETVELLLSGDDLGVLIGSRGATLYAIQDLTRTVVQRRTRAENGRVLVDVGGYRQKRQEALVRFVQKVAAEVRETSTRKALEPMNAADRKVVHDTVNQIEGVITVSEGEDSSRHVVLIPEQ